MNICLPSPKPSRGAESPKPVLALRHRRPGAVRMDSIIVSPQISRFLNRMSSVSLHRQLSTREPQPGFSTTMCWQMVRSCGCRSAQVSLDNAHGCPHWHNLRCTTRLYWLFHISWCWLIVIQSLEHSMRNLCLVFPSVC
jgi:hypothetical protein